MEAVTFVAALAAVLSLTNAGTIPSSTGEHGKLHLLTITPETLEGVFYNDVAGIHFVSGAEYIYVNTMEGEGEPLITADKMTENVKAFQMLQTQFLEVKEESDDDTPTFKELRIPNSLTKATKTALDSRDEEKISEVLRMIRDEQTTENTEKNDIISQLLGRYEMVLMEKAALQLIDLGIAGDQYPSALTFLVTAMRFTGLRMGNETTDLDIDSEVDDSPHRNKRSCPSSCSRCPEGPDCLGMCGIGCFWCWPICPHLAVAAASVFVRFPYGYIINSIINDCCYHHGCYLHDVCCDRHGYSHSKCLFPFGFSCSYYNC